MVDTLGVQRCGACLQDAHSRVKSWYSKNRSNHSQMRLKCVITRALKLIHREVFYESS